MNDHTDQQSDAGLLGGASTSDFEKPIDPNDVNNDNSIEIRPAEEPEGDVVKITRPEDLPTELWDEDKGEFKSQDLYEQYKHEKEKAIGLRQKLSKGKGPTPETADDYQINHDSIADELGIELPEDDPGLKIFKEVSHKYGLDQETFQGIFKDYMSAAMKDEGMQKASKENDVSEEEQQEFIATEMGKLGKNAEGVVKGIKNWNQQLFYDGLLSKEDFAEAQSMGMNAAQIRVLNAYRTASGEMNIPEITGNMDGMPSEQEINKLLASPEYETDQVIQKKVTDYFIKKHG